MPCILSRSQITPERSRPCGYGLYVPTYIPVRLRSSGWNGSAVEASAGRFPIIDLRKVRSVSWPSVAAKGLVPCKVLSPWLSCLACAALACAAALACWRQSGIVPVLLSSFGRQGCLRASLVQRWSIIVLPAGHVFDLYMMRSSQTQLTSPSESTKNDSTRRQKYGSPDEQIQNAIISHGHQHSARPVSIVQEPDSCSCCDSVDTSTPPCLRHYQRRPLVSRKGLC
jgi:hypothetical protein